MAGSRKLSETHRKAMLAAMARKAAAGSTAAAKIVLSEYRAEHAPKGETSEADFSLLDAAFEAMRGGADDGRPV